MANENILSGFNITCTSCAARLKVSKPSLAGRMLACPKCGTMLKVVRPANRPSTQASSLENSGTDQPGSVAHSVSDSDQPTPLKTMLTTGDFDEIEQLLILNPQLINPESLPDQLKFKPAPSHLIKSTTPSINPANRTKPSSAESTGRAKQVPGTNAGHATQKSNATDSNAPLLPSDQWISADSQKRRRMMTLLAAAIGLIMILSMVVVFLLNGFGSKPSSVAQSANPSESKPAAPNDSTGEEKNSDSFPPLINPTAEPTIPDSKSPPTEDPKTSAPETTIDADPSIDSKHKDATEDPALTTSTSPPLSETTEKLTDPPPPILTDDPPPILTDDPPPILTDDSKSTSENPTASTTDTGSTDELPAISSPSVPTPPIANPVNSNQGLSNLDRLSQMVQDSQLSIGKFKDLAASARDDQRVGLPKYLVEKNEPAPVDAAVQLTILCSQLKYEPIPLNIALKDLMTITGVPMTIDVESVIARHGTANPKVELNVQAVDFSHAIDALLQSAELIKLDGKQNQGLIIAARNLEEFQDVEHDLPKFTIAGEDDEKAAIEELSAILQGMIAPDSWKLEQNPARLSFAETKVTVINSPVVQYQVRELLNKVGELVELAKDSTKLDQESPFKYLATKQQRMQTKLELPSGLEHRFSGSLVEVLDTISTKTGVAILADWESLRTLGFGPLTTIPGNLTGDTLRDALKELTQTLEVTYLIVDEQTILLTSFDAAFQRTDLEVYSFKKLLKGKVTEDQALAILNQSLAEELKNPLIRSYYSKRLQGLFVVAPQMLHKKIDAILRALETM